MMNVIESNSSLSTIQTITQGKTTSQLYSEYDILGPGLSWTYIILQGLQGIFAMVVNLLTMIAVYRFEFLWENSGCRMVAGLALADFFGGVTPLFELIPRLFTSSISLLNAFCYVQASCELLAGFGNVFCTLLCTIDRYIFITKPLRYFSIVTPGRALRAIFITWMVIVLQIILMLAFGPSFDAEITCGYDRIVSELAVYLVVGQFVLVTFFVIIPLYMIIGCTAYKLSRNEPHYSNYPSEAQAIQKAKLRERKMVKTIGWVLGTFLVCFILVLAYSMFLILSGYSDPLPFGILLTHRIIVLVYNIQFILNPFIYTWKNLLFRKAYKRLLPKRCKFSSM